MALSLSLSACGKEEQNIQKNVSIPQKKQVEAEKDLMEWIKSGESVEYKIEMDGTEITMMAKGEKVRVEGIPFASFGNSENADMEKASGVSLTIGDWIYMWNKDDKKGTKFNQKEMKKIGDSFGDEEEQEEQDTWEDQVENLENDGV